MTSSTAQQSADRLSRAHLHAGGGGAGHPCAVLRNPVHANQAALPVRLCASLLSC